MLVNMMNPALVLLLIAVAYVSADCGCLKCSKHLQSVDITGPTGYPVKVIFKKPPPDCCNTCNLLPTAHLEPCCAGKTYTAAVQVPCLMLPKQPIPLLNNLKYRIDRVLVTAPQCKDTKPAPVITPTADDWLRSLQLAQPVASDSPSPPLNDIEPTSKKLSSRDNRRKTRSDSASTSGNKPSVVDQSSRSKRDLAKSSYNFLMNMLPQYVREPLHHSIRGVSMGRNDHLPTLSKLRANPNGLWNQSPNFGYHSSMWPSKSSLDPLNNFKYTFRKKNPPSLLPHPDHSLADAKLKSLLKKYDTPDTLFGVPKLSGRDASEANEAQLLKKLKKLNNNPFVSNIEDQATDFMSKVLQPKRQKRSVRPKRTIILSSNEIDLPPHYEVELVSEEDDNPELYDSEEIGPIVGGRRNTDSMDFDDESEERNYLKIPTARRLFPRLPPKPEVVIGKNVIQKAVREELNAYHKKIENEQKIKEMKANIQNKHQRKSLVPQNPIFMILTAPMKFLKHFHDVNKGGVAPVMTSLPKLVYTTKKYFRDFGKNFHKNCLNLASDLIGDFDHVQPNVIERISDHDGGRYRRNIWNKDADELFPPDKASHSKVNLKSANVQNEFGSSNFFLRKSQSSHMDEDLPRSETYDHHSDARKSKRDVLNNADSGVNKYDEQNVRLNKKATDESIDPFQNDSFENFNISFGGRKNLGDKGNVNTTFKEKSDYCGLVHVKEDVKALSNNAFKKQNVYYETVHINSPLRHSTLDNKETQTSIHSNSEKATTDISNNKSDAYEFFRLYKDSGGNDHIPPTERDDQFEHHTSKLNTHFNNINTNEQDLQIVKRDPVKIISLHHNQKNVGDELDSNTIGLKIVDKTNEQSDKNILEKISKPKKSSNFRQVADDHVRKRRYVLKVVDDHEIQDQVEDYLAHKMDEKFSYLKPLQDYYDKVNEFLSNLYTNHKPPPLQNSEQYSFQRSEERKHDETSGSIEESIEDKPKRKRLRIKKVKPRVIIDNKGLPFMEYDGYKRPLFLNKKSGDTFKNHPRSADSSSEETSTKIANLIARAKEDSEVVGASHRDLVPHEIIKERISSLLEEIDQLVHLNPEDYDHIFEDLIQMQHIKLSIEQDWKRLLIDDRADDINGRINLLSKFKDLQHTKDRGVKNIAKELEKNDNEFVRRQLMHSLIRLQKLQCLISNVLEDFDQHLKMKTSFNTKKEIKYVDFLSELKFVYAKTKTRNDLVKKLCQDRDAEGQKNIELLHKLKKLLISSETPKTDQVGELIWEMKNLEKMQMQTIKEMNKKLSKSMKIKKELKILFDTQKRFDECEIELNDLLGNSVVKATAKGTHKKDVKEIIAEIKKKHEEMLQKAKERAGSFQKFNKT